MFLELQQKKGKKRSTKKYVPVQVSCIITPGCLEQRHHAPRCSFLEEIWIQGQGVRHFEKSSLKCWAVSHLLLLFPSHLFFSSPQALSQKVKEQNYISCLFLPVHINLPSCRHCFCWDCLKLERAWTWPSSEFSATAWEQTEVSNTGQPSLLPLRLSACRKCLQPQKSLLELVVACLA